jgi:hypothetical protein
MVICESYMFEFSISKDMKLLKKNNNKRRIPTYLLTLIVKKVGFYVEHDKMVTTLNIIKH